MRLIIKLSVNTEQVPFSYQTNLTGALHKWLGENEFHGAVSLYSFSNLMGGELVRKQLQFKQGATWFISAYDKELIKKIVSGVFDSPELAFGMKVQEVTIQQDPELEHVEYFKIASPIFIKRQLEDQEKHYTYLDAEAENFLTETLRTKMELVGLKDDSLQVRFDTQYQKAKVRLVQYKDYQNKCSWCPIIIKGKPESKLFAWNVGVGNSTGIGFGAIL